MELSVEICQELLKHKATKTIPCNVSLELNATNGNGMTALDVAVDIKQNQALEFAIYYNKNMLPAL